MKLSNIIKRHDQIKIIDTKLYTVITQFCDIPKAYAEAEPENRGMTYNIMANCNMTVITFTNMNAITGV